MAFRSALRRIIWLAVLATLVFAATAMNSPNESQFCEMTVFVGDTTALPNSINTVVSVFADNIFDTIVGFALRVQLNRPPDIMIFQTDSGTAVDTLYWFCTNWSGMTCLDSVNVPAESTWDFFHIDTFDVEVGSIDTTGTLIGGWEYVNTRSLSGNGTDLLIVAIANLAGPPVTKGFAPQQGGRLVKILADVLDIEDTLSDRIVTLNIDKDFKDYLNIVTPDPNWSIWTYEDFLDTNGWVCTQWSIDSGVNPPETLGCLAYQQTSLPPWDSIEIVTDSQIVLDTSRICLYDGTLIVLPGFLCGDVNGDQNVGNILDLNFLINRIFRNGPESDPPESADMNCDGGNGNILDLNLLINRIFRNGPPVCTGPLCN